MNRDTPIVTAGDLVDAVLAVRKGGGWTEERILTEIAKAQTTRKPIPLVIEVAHAAIDDTVRGPGAIPSHKHQLATGCAACEQRERSKNPSPPPVTKCDACGRITEPGINHDCRHHGPPAWVPEVNKLNASYGMKIRLARESGDHDLADELKTELDQKRDALTGATPTESQVTA